MATTLTLDVLTKAVSGTAAAFRCRRTLQPAGGPGDKVFPPTFAGAVYAMEHRRIPGREEPVQCVVLDTVQSQANRMELALQGAIDAGRLTMPLLVVDFSAYDPTEDPEADEKAGRFIESVGRITSLQVPHRLADAILRDSEIDGVAFRRSEKGKALNRVSFANATPLLELCPTALVFGMWDSTGPKGGLGPKFERALVSEIVGIGAEWHDDYRSRGVRRDPLEISKNVPVVQAEDKSLLKVAEGKEKGVRPSEINHSSVPVNSPNSGVTVDHAIQTTTLSLIALRRPRFPLNGNHAPGADLAARTTLAALGLCAATLAFEAGLDLRSRCLLWPEVPMSWELLDRPGTEPEEYSLTGAEAVELLALAVAEAKGAGLPWPEVPVQLTPSAELAKLVRLSQGELVRGGA
ncbi:MAG: type I-U CRISPR-associated RAMP protein Csb1/Cas7u [Gemmatimonadales bacterium]